MKKIFPRLSYALLILLLSCGSESPQRVVLTDLQERLITEPLLPVADSLFVLKDSTELYLMDFRRDPPEESRFLLHALVSRDSFINLDFDKKSFRAMVKRIPGWPEFMLWAIPLPEYAVEGYRMGEYKRGPNNAAIKYWQKNLILKDSLEEGLQKCWGPNNTAELSMPKLALDYQFKNGKFLSLPHGYYLLLYNKQCWVFKPKNAANNSKILIHFVNEDGSFDNYSHAKSFANYPSCFPTFDNYEVTRISMAKSFPEYHKLRFGEYTALGNQWVQSYSITNIMQNKLLVFESEIQSASKP